MGVGSSCSHGYGYGCGCGYGMVTEDFDIDRVHKLVEGSVSLWGVFFFLVWQDDRTSDPGILGDDRVLEVV